MNRLKQLRIEADESQEYVGKLIGVSGQAVGQYELGKRSLSQEKIIILANHFNCSTDYLLGESDIRNPKSKDILELAKIGFNMDNYTPPTEKQKEQIRDLLEIILKDNKRKDK